MTKTKKTQNNSFVEKVNWGNKQELEQWVQGPEWRKNDLSYLQYNINELKIDNHVDSVIAFNYAEKAMRLRTLMHKKRDKLNVSELEKYNESAKTDKSLYFLTNVSLNKLYNANLPEQKCMASVETQEKFQKKYSLNSEFSQDYRKAIEEKQFTLIESSDTSFVHCLVGIRQKLSKERYLRECGREMPRQLESTLKSMHEKTVTKYLHLPHWHYGDPARINTGASASTSSSNQSTPQNVTGKGKARFASISLSLTEPGIKGKTSQKNVCQMVPAVRPETFSNQAYSYSDQLVPEILLLATAFVLGLFYRFKNRKNPG